MVTDVDLPRVYVTVPGVEDLTSVIILLRAAGARITDQYREFLIEGPLTAVQANATWHLSQHVDDGSEGKQLEVRVDPAGDLRVALAAMCPDGLDDGRFDWRSHDRPGSNQWWAEQQRRQRELQRP